VRGAVGHVDGCGCGSLALALCCVLFFFFQAEDGIRDFHVTGVQTCALPISCGRSRPRPACHSPTPASSPAPTRRTASASPWWPRSEERRVGKECRSRWSPDHEQTKQDRHIAPAEALTAGPARRGASELESVV